MAHILKDPLQESLLVSCSVAECVNRAVDRWSDPRGRRYQSVTAGFIQADLTTSIALLAMKEVKTVHERAAELRLMI
jgi:hypothetical protein